MKKYYIVGNRAFETWNQASEYCESCDLDSDTMITEVTDGMKMGSNEKTNNINITYRKENTNIQTVYTIEYITNKQDYDLAYNGKHPAPWELYKTIKTEDLQNAITIFIAHYASALTYDVKLFEEIIFNSEVIREQYITDILNFDGICAKNNERLRDIIQAKEEAIDILSEKAEEAEIIKRAFGKDQYDKFIREQRARTA